MFLVQVWRPLNPTGTVIPYPFLMVLLGYAVDTIVCPHDDDENLMVAEQIASRQRKAQNASSEKGI